MEEEFSQNLLVGRKNYWRFAIALAAIVAVGLGGYFVWSQYFSPRAKERRWQAEQVEIFYREQARFEKAMKEDIYGGKTPQETLDLFVAALKKGDIDLAAKYFQLETNENDPNYLTRKKWEDVLKKTKEEGKLPEIIALLERAQPAGSSVEGGFGFEIRNIDGSLAADINMQLNKYSNVWKIESL